MVQIQVRSLTKSQIESIKLQEFNLVEESNSIKIEYYSRKPFYNGILHYSEPKRLPIGKYYDVYSSSLFVGNLFEFGISYKFRFLPNSFCVYKYQGNTDKLDIVLLNSRWVCYANNLDNPSSLLFCCNKPYISLAKL